VVKTRARARACVCDSNLVDRRWIPVSRAFARDPRGASPVIDVISSPWPPCNACLWILRRPRPGSRIWIPQDGSRLHRYARLVIACACPLCARIRVRVCVEHAAARGCVGSTLPPWLLARARSATGFLLRSTRDYLARVSFAPGECKSPPPPAAAAAAAARSDRDLFGARPWFRVRHQTTIERHDRAARIPGA